MFWSFAPLHAESCLCMFTEFAIYVCLFLFGNKRLLLLFWTSFFAFYAIGPNHQQHQERLKQTKCGRVGLGAYNTLQ